MQRYFTKEDINRLFSGSLTKAESEKRKDLAMKFLDVVLDHKSGLADIEAARSKFPAPSVTDSDTNASIRYDLKFPAGGPPDFHSRCGLTMQLYTRPPKLTQTIFCAS